MRKQVNLDDVESRKSTVRFGSEVGSVLFAIAAILTYYMIFMSVFDGESFRVGTAIAACLWTGLSLLFFWRMSNKRGVFGFLTGIALSVVLVGLAILMNHFNAKQDLKAQIEILNQDLPKMLIDDIRINSATLNGFDVIYNATVLGLSADEIDRESFAADAKALFIPDLCFDHKVRASLSSGLRLVYEYSDESDIAVATVVIGKTDCDL